MTLKESFPESAVASGVEDLSVGALARRELVHCRPEDTVTTAARRMRDASCGSVLITDGQGAVAGIWTEHDALRLDLTDDAVGGTPLRAIMSSPVHSLPSEAPVAEAQLVLQERGIRHLLVCDAEGAPLGVVSETDLAQVRPMEAYLSLRQVRTMVSPMPPLLDPHLPLPEATPRILRGQRTAAVVRFPDGDHGILTARDVVRLLSENRVHQSVGEAASRPLLCVAADDTVLEAQQRMIDEGVRRLGVVDGDGELIGLVGFTELLATSQQGLLRELEQALAATRGELQNARSQKRRFDHVQANAPVGLLAVELDGTVFDANRRAADLFGVEPNTMVGTALTEWLPDASGLPDDLDTVRRAEREAVRKEVELAESPGAHWVEIVATLVRDDAGHPEALSIVVNDITSLKEAERKEAERRRYYEQMFHKNIAPKLLIDPEDGRIADANPAALSFYGYSLGEICRLRIQDVNQLSEDEVVREMEKARAEHRGFFAFRHRLANGEVRDVNVYSGPVTVNDREYLHSIIHDVTDIKRYQTELEDYRAIFDALPVGVYRNQPGRQGGFERVNPAMARILGAASTEELLSYPVATFYRDPASRDRFQEELLREGQVERYELPLQTLQGHPLWGAITARVHELPSGEQVFDGVLEDVTEHRHAEQLNQSLLRNLAEGVFGTDRNGNFTFLNPAAVRLLGLQREEAVLGRNSHAVSHHSYADGTPFPESECPIYHVMTTGESLEAWEDTFWRADGTNLPVEVFAAPLYDPAGEIEGVVVSFQDISERKELERELVEQATTDPLTGVANRRRFVEELQREHARARRDRDYAASVLLLDIDHFKDVNDTYGHDVGDEVLKQVTSILQEHLRTADLLGRLGGEEFAVLLPQTPPEEAERVAEKARRIVAGTMMECSENPRLQVTVSIGVAWVDPDDPAPEEALKRADQAVYTAKERGRNRVERSP